MVVDALPWFGIQPNRSLLFRIVCNLFHHSNVPTVCRDALRLHSTFPVTIKDVSGALHLMHTHAVELCSR
jgi:hypothetical protein